MHPSCITNCKHFFDAYSDSFDTTQKVKVIEIGSQDVNGSLRVLAPPAFDYVGVDFIAAKGVDVVLTDPYVLPFADNSADIMLTNSCLEHSEMFWLVFLEMMRVLKPAGLLYMNVPSNGSFHRYPVDCWRFYPDTGGALVTWARRNNINALLLESYVSLQQDAEWNDFVGVFLKDESYLTQFPKRIVDSHRSFRNGVKHGTPGFINASAVTEDKNKLDVIKRIIEGKVKIV